MKILKIAPQIPLPLNDGGRIGIYNITKYLTDRGHQIDFVVYKKYSDKEAAYRELSKICNPFILDVNTEYSLVGVIKNIFPIIPLNISKYKSKTLEKFLVEYFQKNKVDIIHVDHLHMGWVIDILRELTNDPLVLREHNLEMRIMQRYSDRQKNPILKLYSKLQLKKFIKYEPELCGKFDASIMISEHDEKQLLFFNNKIKTYIIPAGVNSNLFRVLKTELIPFSIFHIGSLLWYPNFDGLKWYLTAILLLIIKKKSPKLNFIITVKIVIK